MMCGNESKTLSFDAFVQKKHYTFLMDAGDSLIGVLAC